MRLISVNVFLFLLCSVTFAQTEKLPDILKPDAASEAEAQRIGAKVFKLLPVEMFPANPYNAFHDEDNPIGIRGGGSYYSFTTSLHSANSIRQIYLDGPQLRVISSPYGFLADIGRRDLSGIDSTLPEARFFLSFKPASSKKDFETDRDAIHNGKVIRTRPPNNLATVVGDAYLLRAITWDKADIMVAFKILKVETDGSVTIIWKKLADFPKPIVQDDEKR